MIAFDSDRDGNRNIYVMGRLGQDVRRVTSDLADDRAPSFSPDGRHLVFQSDRNGSDDLYTIDLETGAIEQLTNLPGDAGEPDWSPDGSRIAFINDHQLHVLNTESGRVVAIATNLPRVHGPAWSPSGDRLAVFARPHGHDDIVIIDMHRGGARIVTDDPGHDFSPCWISSERLLFASNATPSGRAELRLVDLQDGYEIWATTDFARATDPDYHASGFSGGVLVSDRSGDDEIYLGW